MFGCTLWVREYRTGREPGNSSRHIRKTKRDPRLVRVVRAEELKITDFQLKPDGCVLFAMLVGGDYDRQGLKGCGTVNALKEVKAGLGRSLYPRQGQTECNTWRENVLKRFIARQLINLVVPGDYPKFDTLEKCKSPETHSDAELRNHASAN
jgi:Holliday junction resolvase YEN1